MEIKLLNSEGVFKTESKILKQLKTFPAHWRGYASLELIDKNSGNCEIDLVLVTHDRIIIIELKDWNGVLKQNGDRWYVNGNDRGRSPVKVTKRKVLILKDRIEKKLKHRFKDSIFVDCRVVLTGSANKNSLDEYEKGYVLQLDEFLKLPQNYKQIFENHVYGNPSQNIAIFDSFFNPNGGDFKAKEFTFNNYLISKKLFEHPRKFYEEYMAQRRDDRNYWALLRKWDFTLIPDRGYTSQERAEIALRESRVIGYISHENEELRKYILEPISNTPPDEIPAEFCELYHLPRKQQRLADFINQETDAPTESQRIDLIKSILEKFAELHNINVAHRDIGTHSLWVAVPTKVSISSFITAYYPEIETLGDYRVLLEAGNVSLPEDVLGDDMSDPFCKDVYLLGVICYCLAYSEYPPTYADQKIYEWGDPKLDPFQGKLDDWLKAALSFSAKDRYPNARKMLDALNAIVLFKRDDDASEMLKRIDTYSNEILPWALYPQTETIGHKGTVQTYCSGESGDKYFVKVKHGVAFSEKNTAPIHRALVLLDRLRLLTELNLSCVPKIIDFGLSKCTSALFMVQQYLPSVHFNEVKELAITLRLRISRDILKGINSLHELGLFHGDLKPEHILCVVCEDDAEVRFADMVDFHDQPGERANTRYNPASASSPAGRDRYAAIMIVKELLSGEDTDPNITNEIDLCLSAKPEIVSTEDVVTAIESILNPEKSNIVQDVITVHARNIPEDKIMLSDNGVYHVITSRDYKHKDTYKINVVGVRQEILIYFDNVKKVVSGMSIKDLQHSTMLERIRNRNKVELPGTITLHKDSFNNTDQLLHQLLSIPAIAQQFEPQENFQDDPAEREIYADLESVPNLPVKKIWQAIIDGEEDVLPVVEVTGEIETSSSGATRIPYTFCGKTLDFADDDVVEVLRDGDLRKCGNLDCRNTNRDFLFVVSKTPLSLQVGQKVRLRTKQDKASFARRKSAVQKIFDGNSVIANLIEYFEPACSLEPVDYGHLIEDRDIEGYNLNPHQSRLFKNLFRYGPLGLLQGPPGTGKTYFISSFVHFLITNRHAKHILLVSQSHEAVNNAAEKIRSLSAKQGANINLVRFGAEGMVSSQLLDIHSMTLQQYYRDMFKAEAKLRIFSIARGFNLPADYVEELLDLEFQIGDLVSDIKQINLEIEENLSLNNEFETDSVKQLREVLKRRERTIADKLVQLYPDALPSVEDLSTEELYGQVKSSLAAKYHVISLDKIQKIYSLMSLGKEWVQVLGNPRSNFDEFLAKTRNLVCGTCVGIGKRHLGIVDHQYDWVIVDEAARCDPGELSIAIQAGKRVLLVGDHKQLAPLYQEDHLDAACANLGITDRDILRTSDFRRAFQSPYGKEIGDTLIYQYRMAKPIGDLVSTCFYAGMLKNGKERNNKALLEKLPCYLSETVSWLDTSSMGNKSFDESAQGREAKSFINKYEVRVITQLLKDIVTSPDLVDELCLNRNRDEAPIGIICTYSAQKNYLYKKLSEEEWFGNAKESNLIKVDTVDSYQGKENRIIILSLVRNNHEKKQGFLREDERINVSLSRAMDGLFIVGASRMWSDPTRDFPLNRVVDYIQQNTADRQYRVVDAKVEVFRGGN